MSSPARAERVLLIDDDVELCSMLQEYLARHGWVVTTRHSGESGLQAALEAGQDIVLLDAMLPDFDGFEVLRRLRQQSRINVMLLTARGDEIDRIVGLELGADDYLPKPFNPRELVARMRAVVRRNNSPAPAIPSKRLSIAGFTVDGTTRNILFGNQRLELTDIEYLLLGKLLENPYQIVSREDLVEQVLERPFRPLDRSIDMHLSRLRRKLESLTNFRGGIKTVRNSGYMFLPTQEVSP